MKKPIKAKRVKRAKPTQIETENNLLAKKAVENALEDLAKQKGTLSTKKNKLTAVIRGEETLLALGFKQLKEARENASIAVGVTFTKKQKEVIKTFCGESTLKRILTANNADIIELIKRNIKIRKENIKKLVEQQKINKKGIYTSVIVSRLLRENAHLFKPANS